MIETDRLLGALKERYGYERFRPQQREAVEHVLSGGDALVLMPTGGGKSLCYQLPAMLSDGLTVVVSPLIALMHDQVQALRRIGAEARVLNSALSPMETADVERSIVDGAVRMLYVAPERVNTERFRELLERRTPALIAIDEAHCISEWGHEFRPDYRVLRRLTERFVDVPTVACTATATPQVQRDIVEQLDRPRMRTFVTNFMRGNLTLRIVPKRKAKERLIARLSQMPGQSAIVYSQTRKTTESFAQQLRQHGIAAEHYHAGMAGGERHAVQDRFLSGATPVICATIAFGMGIDKPDIRLVAHLDMPPSIESYYQEIGRAGRDGEASECLMFYTKGVWHQQTFFINQLQDDVERQRRLDRLRTMMNFCEQPRCRWQRILSYFGDQDQSEACGHCDNCLGDSAAELDAVEASAAEPRRRVDPENPPPPPGSVGSSPLSAEESELYEALRQWRRQMAKTEVLPDYVIASNKDLDELARSRPATLAQLLAVKGFGPKRVENYGEALLAVIAEHVRSQALDEQQEEQPSMQMELDAAAESMPTEGVTSMTIDMMTGLTTDEADLPPPESWQQRFNALAEWRTAASAEAACDPSALLSLPAMRQIAQTPPSTADALGRVEGVGGVVIERHADQLLELLGVRPAPTPVVETVTPAASGDDVPSWRISVDLYRDGHTVLAIAERRMLSPGTIASHLKTAIRQGLEIDLRRSLPPDEVVRLVGRLLSETPDASISDLHERLGYRLSRAELSLVVDHLRPPEPASS